MPSRILCRACRVRCGAGCARASGHPRQRKAKMREGFAHHPLTAGQAFSNRLFQLHLDNLFAADRAAAVRMTSDA